MDRSEVRSDRAAADGRHPYSSAMRNTRSRVAGETPGRPLRAYDTTAIDTPAARATSVMVGRLRVCGLDSGEVSGELGLITEQACGI